MFACSSTHRHTHMIMMMIRCILHTFEARNEVLVRAHIRCCVEVSVMILQNLPFSLLPRAALRVGIFKYILTQVRDVDRARLSV